jgi:hypothetical protein
MSCVGCRWNSPQTSSARQSFPVITCSASTQLSGLHPLRALTQSLRLPAYGAAHSCQIALRRLRRPPGLSLVARTLRPLHHRPPLPGPFCWSGWRLGEDQQKEPYADRETRASSVNNRGHQAAAGTSHAHQLCRELLPPLWIPPCRSVLPALWAPPLCVVWRWMTRTNFVSLAIHLVRH